MKKIIIYIFAIGLLFTTKSCVFAENNPTEVPNNIFGIHITDEKDILDAASLVNSSGGDWGYVTLVVTERERGHDRWQLMFDQMRKLHLIPIVRIATNGDGNNWEVPKNEEIDNWIGFLNSLNWVVQNRYIVIGNEPNHASEWGGTIDPAAYATYLNTFADKLHAASPDFFVLPAGFDASAIKTTKTMDEITFITIMLTAEPDLFDNLDGWTSHSYPNPDFAGKATDVGRGTVYTFEWELDLLRSFGIFKDLPVFITETGWSNQDINQDEIVDMYEYAFSNVWNGKRVVAVTPFILNYPTPPFSQFSWKKSDGSVYPYYEGYRSIPKIRGKPVQIGSGQILGALIQPVILANSELIGAVLVRNTGQSIWNTNNIDIVGDNGGLTIKNTLLFDIEPTKTGLIVFRAIFDQKKGLLIKSIYISDKDNKRITNSFPIEALIVKIDKMQMYSFFARINSYLRNLAKGP